MFITTEYSSNECSPDPVWMYNKVRDSVRSNKVREFYAARNSSTFISNFSWWSTTVRRLFAWINANGTPGIGRRAERTFIEIRCVYPASNFSYRIRLEPKRQYAIAVFGVYARVTSASTLRRAFAGSYAYACADPRFPYVSIMTPRGNWVQRVGTNRRQMNAGILLLDSDIAVIVGDKCSPANIWEIAFHCAPGVKRNFSAPFETASVTWKSSG